MTSNKQTPREFWKWEMRLEDMVNRNTRSNNIYYRVMSPTEKIEVIEYSAYEAAQAEAEKYKQLAEMLRKALANECCCSGETSWTTGESITCDSCDILTAYDAAIKETEK